MTVENDSTNKENAVANNLANSDDSYSGASFPWFPVQGKRKSRLGTYRKERTRTEKTEVTTSEAGTDSVSTYEPVEAPCISSQSTVVPTLEPIFKISPPVYDFESPLTASQTSPFSAFEPIFSMPSTAYSTDSRTPSLSLSSTSAETGLFSNYDFKIPNFAPKSASTKILGSVRSVSPPLNDVKPFNVLQPSQNTNLKSSLKKPISSAVEDKPNTNSVPRETTPRKEVRFAEPAPLPRSMSHKSGKELPSYITVKNKTYSVWRELGSGGSCVVYAVFEPETNNILAIKRVLLPEEEEHAYVAEGYLQEVKMLEKLQQTCSDVIIKIFDHELVYENGKRILYVVLEKGETDLSKYMSCSRKEGKLRYTDILHRWSEMLSAVSKIHDEEIIHLDLKPANFLLVEGRLKLIDFGIASSMPGDKTSIYLEATSGTLSYTSPETLSMTYSPVGSAAYRISKKSDVWSLGCILYRWIYGHVPFQTSLNKWQRLQDIMSPDKMVEFPDREDIPEPLLRSLQSCLQKDPKKRPTVKELLHQKFEIFLDQYAS